MKLMSAAASGTHDGIAEHTEQKSEKRIKKDLE